MHRLDWAVAARLCDKYQSAALNIALFLVHVSLISTWKTHHHDLHFFSQAIKYLKATCSFICATQNWYQLVVYLTILVTSHGSTAKTS